MSVLRSNLIGIGTLALFARSQAKRKLEAALTRVSDIAQSADTEPTTEEAGLLYGFILAQRVPGKSAQVESTHVKKVQEAIRHWQEKQQGGTRPSVGTGRHPRQDLIGEIVLKVRLKRFDRLGTREIELVRGVLEGLYACNYKGTLADHLARALKHYEDAAPDRSMIPELLARRNVIIFLLLAFLSFPVAYQLYGPEESLADAARLVSSAKKFVHPPQDRPHRLSQEERLARTITDYEERLDADLESEEAPALRFALGNLHLKKRKDYDEAARNFELLLYDYPEWPNMRQVYAQLEYCYDQMGDESKREDLFLEMKKRFPKDSREYQYAVSQLGY